eukprot:4498525-Pyramimonas_sp.AAC.1
MMSTIEIPLQVPTSCTQSPKPSNTSQGSRLKGVRGVPAFQAAEAVLADPRAQVGPVAQAALTRVPHWANGDRLAAIKRLT